MKKKASKSWTKKRKARALIGEWTKANHKRLMIDHLKKKENDENL